MSEGELKKQKGLFYIRLAEELSLALNCPIKLTTAMVPIRNFSYSWQKIIDEAKKEWELIEEKHRKLTEEDPMHDYEGDEEHYDKDAWKKKWLGDSS